MAVPKRRTSTARRDKRRSHHRLGKRNLTYCSNCGEAIPSHTVCPHCGHYRGRFMLKAGGGMEAGEE